MDYFLLEPEIAGELGPGTRMDTSVHPPRVESVHYRFSDWLGDDLVEAFPVYLVSEALAARLAASPGLAGFELRHATISRSPEAIELMDGVELPRFRWLDVTGVPAVDDLGVTAAGQVVVSQEALDLLRSATLDNCDIEPYDVS